MSKIPKNCPPGLEPGEKCLKKNIESCICQSAIRDYGLRINLQGAISTTKLFKSTVLLKTAFRPQFLRFSGNNQIFNKNIPTFFKPGGATYNITVLYSYTI